MAPLKPYFNCRSLLAKSSPISHFKKAGNSLTLLALATQGNMTQIVTFLLMSFHPRQARQVGWHDHITKAVFPLAKSLAVYLPANSSTLLAMANLGDVTQIRLFLCELFHPRWPRQVRLGKIIASIMPKPFPMYIALSHRHYCQKTWPI